MNSDYPDITACSAFGIEAFPGDIAHLIATIINIIKIVVPILLIIWGMLDLGKSVIAQKEEEIKKGQKLFLKRLLTAAIVYFIIVIVDLVVGIIGGNGEGKELWDCIDAIIHYKAE